MHDLRGVAACTTEPAAGSLPAPPSSEQGGRRVLEPSFLLFVLLCDGDLFLLPRVAPRVPICSPHPSGPCPGAARPPAAACPAGNCPARAALLQARSDTRAENPIVPRVCPSVPTTARTHDRHSHQSHCAAANSPAPESALKPCCRQCPRCSAREAQIRSRAHRDAGSISSSGGCAPTPSRSRRAWPRR